MTCGSAREILLDMARGAQLPQPARRSVAAHIESCAACAAEFTRQQRLTVGLQALAAEAQTWVPPASAEGRLLEAMATARSGGMLPPRSQLASTVRRRGYAMATAAVVVFGIWAGMRGTRPAGEGPPVPPQIQSPHRKAAGTVGPDRSPVAARRTAAPPRQPSRRPPALRQLPPRALANREPASSWEFTRLPSAIGLPEMESGSVVRMELPIGVLPEYGLDIVPDAARTSIEADVLVGQDGQPRAIRLVAPPDNRGAGFKE